MPTGYTADIVDGKITSFEEFTKKCVRAFGAATHMRDEPLDKEYYPPEPELIYLENLEENQIKLDEFLMLSDEEIIQKHISNLEESKKRFLDEIEKKKTLKDRIIPILEAANNFNPPTDNHQGIKKFMIEQLQDTLSWDGDSSYYEDELLEIETELANIDVVEIKRATIEHLEIDINYYKKEYDKSVERCAKHADWVKKLFNAIN